jgi:hypothetical protein
MRLRLPLLIAAAIAMLAIGVTSVAGASRGLPIRITWFEDPAHVPGEEVPGAYVVQQRGYFSISGHTHFKSLTPGHLYTLWWVIYNDPAACVEGCDLDDAAAALETGTNPANIGFHFAGRFIAASNGRADIGTRLLEDAVTGCQTVPPYDALCVPLIEAATAEATILVQDHGPATGLEPVLVGEAFAQGCKNYKRFDTVVAIYAESGFECFTPQSVHLE